MYRLCIAYVFFSYILNVATFWGGGGGGGKGAGEGKGGGRGREGGGCGVEQWQYLGSIY